MKVIAMLGALLFLAIAPNAPAIDGGVPDGDAHPNVGLLAFDVDGTGPTPPSSSARAALSGPCVPHCAPLHRAAAGAVPPNVEWAVTLEPGRAVGPDRARRHVPCRLSRLLRADGPRIEVNAPRRRSHPDFEPGFVPGTGAPTVGRHDVAVVLFPAGTFAGVEPVRLARPGTLDHPGRRAGGAGRSSRSSASARRRERVLLHPRASQDGPRRLRRPE